MLSVVDFAVFIVAQQTIDQPANPWVLTLLGLVGGGVGTAVVTNIFNRPKSRTDNAATITDMTLDFARELKEQVTKLEGRVEILERDRNRFMQWYMLWRNRSRQLESYIVTVLKAPLPAQVVDHDTYALTVEQGHPGTLDDDYDVEFTHPPSPST
jgi:hypothetical protein